jgi:hypothetical protein
MSQMQKLIEIFFFTPAHVNADAEAWKIQFQHASLNFIDFSRHFRFLS